MADEMTQSKPGQPQSQHRVESSNEMKSQATMKTACKRRKEKSDTKIKMNEEKKTNTTKMARNNWK